MVKKAYQITVMCTDTDMPIQKSEKYYLDYIEPQDYDEVAALHNFIRTATNAFVQDYCIKNKCPKDKVITRFEKVIFATFYGEEIKP